MEELSLKEAAEVLGISLSTARRWVKTGRLNATLREGPYGPEYVIPWEEIERIKAGRPNPPPATPTIVEEDPGVVVPREWLVGVVRQALEQALSNTVNQVARGMEETLTTLIRGVEETLSNHWSEIEQGLRRELEGLRAELATTRELLLRQEEEKRSLEERYARLLEERDKQLMEEMRRMLQPKKKPWWKFWG
ncbi:helix-turn-helix domain-containing protein [Ammonifex thiophilus]|uniref:Helix-turn-helix domain-containing protein n=1 Tax=Ammonifex thiophilus TaxID=444093 RepID=A0A3D8P2L6_9THEO|nr:helix-turn-helix domain-containing protein [Ammonifex thiophilus]RDV80419.1 helix-turn-helix domain-containing protein [Ammonifex thiophilus]